MNSNLASKKLLFLSCILLNLMGYGQIQFIENNGQWPNHVSAKSAVPGGNVWFEDQGLRFELYEKDAFPRHDSLSQAPSEFQKVCYLMALENAHLSHPTKVNPSDSHYNFYLGSDSTNWRQHVRSFSQLVYNEIYESVNLRFLAKGNSIKYQFECLPGFNPNLLAWNYHDSLRMHVNDVGELISESTVGIVTESPPFAYQLIDGRVKEVSCKYVLEGHRVSFELGFFDPTIELIIDPEIAFSSFIGSSANNFGFTACDDENGNLVSGAIVFGNGYPLTPNAYNSTFNSALNNYFDVAISKFNNLGNGLLYSTYIGGNHQETPHSIVVDNNDQIVVFGVTGSNDFPITVGAYQSTFSGGPVLMMSNFFTSGHPDGCDFFISKFNSNGTLASSTYLGGDLNEGLNYASQLFYNYGDAFRGEVNIDNANNIFIASCSKGNSPITGNAIQSSYGGGNSDGYLAKLSSNLNALLWSTYLGGASNDAAYAIEFANDGNLLIGGGTQSSNFNVGSNSSADNSWNGETDGFLMKISASNFSILGGTFVGTTEYDQVYFVQTDLSDNIYCFGQTAGDMPITPGLYGQLNSGQFIRKFNANLSTMVWNTTIGTGSGEIDISPTAFLVSDCNQIYFSGWGGNTNSISCMSLTCQAFSSTTLNLPTTSDAFQSTTDGSDFYLAVLNADATSLEYGSFLGGASSAEHVDGGTSRFDKSGSVYQAVCAGCQNNDDFPTTPGAWSSVNGSTGCNLGVFRFDLGQLEAIASVEGPTTLCVGVPAQFTNGTIGATDYVWSFGDNTTSILFEPQHTYNQPGTYTIQLMVSDDNGCYEDDSVTIQLDVIVFTPPTVDPVSSICQGESIQLNAVGSSNLYWITNPGLSSTTVPNPVATPTTTTSFYAVDFNVCASDTAAVTVQVIVPVAEAGPDETICLGQSVELEGSGGLTYTWSPSSALNFLNIANPLATPSQDETFYVTTTSPEGCIATDSVTIFVVQNAPGGVVYPNVEICLGETAFLQAENAGSWTWSPSNSLNDGNAQNVQATPDETTTYTITMTNICGSGISEVTVEVIELNINASEGGTVCGGTPFPISVTGASLYQWYPVNSVTDLNDSVTFALPESSQWIYVVGTDLNGCSDLDSLYMNILPLPQVDAGPDQYFSFPGEAQLFGNTFGLDYSWSPSNGLSCVACPYPVASPPAPQWYVLSATDDLGCVGVDSVYVRPYFPVYVPNAITPNQDGLNDVFLVVGENLTGFHLEIYDRWGMLVFESNDQAKPWLADYKGYYVQNDVYTWKLSYDSLERRTEQIGHVTVIR